MKFYKSDTGQKFVRIVPDLMRESVKQTSSELNTQLSLLMRELLEEERERLSEQYSDEAPSSAEELSVQEQEVLE